MPLDARIPLQVENRNFAQPLLDLAEKQRVDSLTQSKLAGDAQARTIGDQTIASNNMVNEQAKRELNANEMKAIVMQMESSRRLLEQGNVKNSLAEMMNIRGKLEAAGQDTSGIEKITTLIQSSPEDGTRYLGEAVEAMKPVVEQLFAATGKEPVKDGGFTLREGQTRFNDQNEEVASVAKSPVGGSDAPSAVREFQFFQGLSPEDQERFLNVKRSNPTIDLGGSIARLSQIPGGDVISSLEKGLSPAEQPENISAATSARSGGVNLTPAQKSVDEAFGKDYAEFVAGGGSADSRKQLSQIEEVGTALASGDNLTGPVLGLVPDFITAFTNPESVDVRERFEEVVQRNLRLVLGAQFTEKEGERLISRAYNPRLSEELNGQRVTRLLTQMGQAAAAKNRAAAYFEENGTLQGYQGKLPSINDFNIEDDDNSANTPSVPGTTRVGRFTVEEAN